MKALTITIGNKLYTSSKLTAWHARQAISISKQALELGQKATDGMSGLELLEQSGDIMSKKAALICEIYGGKFTADDLEKNLSMDEIEAQLTAIVSGVSEVVTKN